MISILFGHKTCKTLKTFFLDYGKHANWLLSGGDTVMEPPMLFIEVLHCFDCFVIIISYFSKT